MKSLYQRQFVLMAGMVLISFALLGAAFITLSYQYTMRERQDSMRVNAEKISEFATVVLNRGYSVQSEFFLPTIKLTAQVSDSFVIICSSDGEILYSSDGTVQSNWAGGYLPSGMVRQVAATGSFAAMSDMGGLFAEKRFLAGAPISLSVGTFQPGQGIQIEPRITGMVFLAAETSSITEMWRAFATIFFFTAIVVLFIAFITSSLTSLKQTKPLKEMAEAARKFGHGEFNIRVDYGTRQDEVGELAEAFNAMAESLCKSENRRSEFVANISHELKTPMTTIAGFADGILDGTVPSEKQTAALKTISSETRRLSRLVRRMLDLARLQSEEHVSAQERFDAGEIVLRVLVSLETKINARHLEVDAKLPEEPVMVWGDPDAITQVTYNLLDNAIKFSNEGGNLGIAVTAKGGKASVSVRNEGETIPPDELPMVFDRFHKTDHSRSEDREGVGLGLYIVKTILNSHKENITATSTDGVTEFTFTLTQA